MIAALLLIPTVRQPDPYSTTWDQVANAIRTRYYARDQRKAEMDALLDKYGSQAKAAHTHAEFEEAVNHMIRDFRDSHFAFLTDSDQSYYLMDGLSRGDQAREMPEFGAWFKQASPEGPNPGEGGSTVQMVLNGSEAEKAGLRKGDLVMQVNARPFSPIDSLSPLVGSTVTLTVQRGAETLHPQVVVTKARALDMFLDASRASIRIIDDNGRKIGYFHLWTQASAAFRNALSDAVYGKLRETDGFILDIRDGFGGRPEGFGDPFFRPDAWLNWKYTSKSGFQQLFGYGRPMALLINGGSRSAKEILSYLFKKSRRATLIGQNTAGNVLGTSPQRVNDWAYLEIPIVDIEIDGVRLEGKGVAPDVPVAHEFDAGGNDLDLKEALYRLSTIKRRAQATQAERLAVPRPPSNTH